ncbi:ABC transporter ATP-binding protein [Paenibacillus sp. GCM10023252]|uniref:ABC transporter ATP-binding protein n=1 Tax=Paenibacillus sp. GCM10023252 TaxID=3252649 RepID=UPI003605E26E
MNQQLKHEDERNEPEVPWLELPADISLANHYDHYSIQFTRNGMYIRHGDGTIRMEWDRADIDSIEVRSARGGASLYVKSQGRMIEAARMTESVAELHREAMSDLMHWIAYGAREHKQSEEQSSTEMSTCPQCGRSAPLDKRCWRCRGKLHIWGRLLQYGKPYRHFIVLSGIILAVTSLIQVIPPYLMKMMLDEINTAEASYTVLLWTVVSLFLVRIIESGLEMARGFLGLQLGGKLMRDIRKIMFDKLMDLSMKFFDRRQMSQFIGRINQDTEDLKEFLTDGIIQLMTQTLLAVFIFIMMLQLNWKLTLLILLPLPILAPLFLWLWPKARSMWYSQWHSSMSVQNLIGESLQGIRVIKAFAQEQTEKDRYHRANSAAIQRAVSIGYLWQGISPIVSLVVALCGVGLWYAGGRYVIEGTMSVGSLVAFSTYLTMFFGPVMWLGQSLSWLNQTLGATERVFEIMDTPVDVEDQPDAKPLPIAQGRIQFNQVSYGYTSDRLVLQEISLNIEPGEFIGIVGHSGAGKSTLIHLLCRFYDPDAGSITIDGTNLREIKQADYRNQIGVVLQETFLFDGTIAQNIAYGRPGAAPSQIIEAARSANAHNFISRLPDGYDTRVGERGHRLSGGEKQRIAIARALLRDPRILILDEATSSVDTDTERQIQEALGRLVGGRTTIAIAHRLSTLMGANRLIVLHHGRIAEVGTHHELYSAKGHYYRLIESQRRGQETITQDEEVELAAWAAN